MNRFRNMRIGLSILLALLFVLQPAILSLAEPGGDAPDEQSSSAENKLNAVETTSSGSYYSDILAEWKKAGARDDHGGSLTIPGSQVAGQSANANAVVGPFTGKDAVLIWSAKSDEWIEYEVEIEEGGLYAIEMSYHPFIDRKNRKPIAFNLTVDGTSPYLESKSVQLYRQWRDRYPIRTDDRGDEIRPLADDVSGWMNWELRDMSGSYLDPLTWYLKPGKHIVRLAGSDPVAIESITFKAPDNLQDYKTVLRGLPKEASPVQADPIEIEAERVEWKNDSSISLAYDNDIANRPYVRGKITFNTIGGNWSSGNQEINWSFEVPESGYYKIAMRAQQSFVSNHASFRTILINGKVPFNELKAYRFDYAHGWKGVPLADEAGSPYTFYLNEGVNTITMRVTQAPFKTIGIELDNEIQVLRELHNDLMEITGGVSDTNRTWSIRKDLPGFVEKLSGVYNRIEEIRGRLVDVNGRSDAITQALVTIRNDIGSLLKDEDGIPYYASRFVLLQGQLADQINQLSSQPLLLDRIFIVPAEQSFPRMEATTWEKIEGGFVNFTNSFMPKQRISDINDEVLNVWVLRGRDYVNLLQQLADEMFTPETGIKVKVNLLRDEKLLLLMNAAGIAPDVVLGLPENLPFDYAIRNAIYDVSQFPDFEEYYKRFAPGSWTPFYYDGGYYGVPETQSFEMMYYRKDILDRLDLKVPDTWDELYKMLPVLQQNGMNFTTVGHGTFLQMHGAEYFTQDGTKTGFNAEQGFQAFKAWTDLQNKYGIDQKMDSFYQHFREGSYPIGIADINSYIQFHVAAPELNGLWGIAPVPGVKQADGTVVRWLGGNMQASTIFKQTKKPEESWEFVKWWTSAEVQERYGMDLETLYGITFRWNTSNIDAFVRLPWKDEDLKQIMEQWRWFREIPNVPGNYYIERELLNAWTRTVVNGENYRVSLETFVKNVNQEILRKEQEFNFIDENGNVLRSLDLPVITEPWEGVGKYAQ
ncbi:extracellular solute-binding protein [Paenibacillus tarimensis]